MLKTLGKQIKEFKLVSILTPIAMLAEVIVENFIPLLMATIIDSIGSGDLNSIYRTACIMIVLAIAGLISGYLGGVFGANASAGFARNLRKAMFENIQTFSFSNIDKFSTAGLVTRLTTDVTNMQNAYQMILRMAVRAPFSLIVAMIMAFTVSPRLASIYLIAVIILGCICALIIKFAFKYFNQVFKKYDALNESVQENVTAMRVVKAYVREDHEKKKFGKASEAIYKMFVKAEGIVALNNPVMMTTVYTCILLISWVGAHMIVASGNNAALGLTTGNLTSMLAYCMNILMNLMMLSMVFVMITMSMASARRIAEVLNEKPDITNPEDPDFDVPDGSIEFKNVTFRYNSKSEKPILENINVKIKSGETIGIIGGTGSAKSSLVNLISRLYDIEEQAVKDGEEPIESYVSIGGKDVRSYDLETVRQEVSVVLQSNVLFTGSILDNLRWGNPEATDEECIRVCKLACADDDDGIFCPKNVVKGKIVKAVNEDGTKRYDFQFSNKRGYKTTIEGLSDKFNPEYWNYAKLISGVLRYGMPIPQVLKLVSSLELDSQSINSWKNGVERALKKYLPNGTKANGQTCPHCGNETLIYQEGCLICTSCGTSKCG